MKHSIDIDENYIGYSDYWSGHGHCFEENLICCTPLHIPITYKETIEEMLEIIIDEYNAMDTFPVDEKKYEKLPASIHDEVIGEIKEYFKTDNPKDKFFDNCDEYEVDIDEDDICCELPVYILIIHIYEEE